MIKKIGLLILALLLFACGGKKEAEKIVISQVEPPKEWLVFDGSDANAKRIVFISGDEEYRSEEGLPQLAKILSRHYGFNCTVLFAQDPENPGIIDPNYTKNIPGLNELTSADMMIIQTRFRALPDSQMQYIDDYLKAGKPVLGIRTATHAFNFDSDSTSNFVHYGNYYKGDKAEWKDGFGRFVLGENWVNHHGHHKHQSTRGIIVESEKTNPITNGLHDNDIWCATDVYGVRLPLPGDSKPIILGQVVNRAGKYDERDLFYGMKPSDIEIADKNSEGMALNNPMMPVAWTKTYKLQNGNVGKIFTTTMGSATDLLNEGVRRLIVNGVLWAMDLEVPAKANVDLVQPYKPSSFGFKTDEYWSEKKLRVTDLE